MASLLTPYAADLENATVNRDIALRAYQKALKAGRAYSADSVSITRYDIVKLRDEYLFWQDQVSGLTLTGSRGTMRHRRVIPLDS